MYRLAVCVDTDQLPVNIAISGHFCNDFATYLRAKNSPQISICTTTPIAIVARL